MKPLVITEAAINLIGGLGFAIEDLLIEGPYPKIESAMVHYGHSGTYIRTPNCDASVRLLIIRRWAGGLFEGVPEADRRSVFDRCVRLALRSFDKSIALNPHWLPFRQDNRVSVFAYDIGRRERLIAETHFQQSEDVYVFGLTPGKVRDLSGLRPDIHTYRKACEEYQAIGREVRTVEARSESQIDLEQL